jgi:hypothetical protein
MIRGLWGNMNNMNYSDFRMLDADVDSYFEDAARIVITNQSASASLLQRKLCLGYARCAHIMDQLQEAGIIGPADGANPRKIYFESWDELVKSKPRLMSSINLNKLLESTGPFGQVTQYSLFLTVIIVIIGLFKITDHNFKLLYSLVMIIAASVGKTGSDVAYYNYQNKFGKNVKNMWQRSIAYDLLWLFGILGLIF